MIDNEGKPYTAEKTELKCSMTVWFANREIYLVFYLPAHPIRANEFIDFMLAPALQIQTAMYLEGGPESTLYVKTKKTESKIREFVTYFKTRRYYLK
jgi:fumarate reductase subunit C